MSETVTRSPVEPLVIERLADEVVYQNPFITVHFDPVRFPGGSHGRYTRIEVGTRPGVAVLPVRAGHVGLVRQFRYPIGAHAWEIPRGFGISGDPAADARQELAEETGAEPTEMVDLGSVHPDSGILDSRVALFLARLEPGSPFGPVDEVDDAMWLPVPQARSAIAAGDIADAFTIAAVTRALLRGLL